MESVLNNDGGAALAVRPAVMNDIPRILQLVNHSRGIMRANGNFVQWDGYPGSDLIGSDIDRGIGHVVVADGQAVGYFALLLDPEPTYAYIEDGLWLDDTTPYGTIHRLACAPGVHVIARCAFAWSESRCASIRVDTHKNNHIMLHIIEKFGYSRCGVVYMRDGTPREAFQKYPELNRDMVYTIAAYHDTGVVEGRERHHLVSGRIIREDARLHEWFSPEQIETMAQAAEDHRASADIEPRSMYGRIVAEADRDIEPVNIVRRTVQFGLSHFPELDKEGHWQRTLQHLHEKYAEGGYLKLFIPCSRNGVQLQKLRALIADETRLRQVFEKLKIEN